MFVKPKKGETVLDPSTGQALPADGADVANTPYWARLERRGLVACTRGEDEPAPERGAPAPAKARPKRAPLTVSGNSKLAGKLTVGRKK